MLKKTFAAEDWERKYLVCNGYRVQNTGSGAEEWMRKDLGDEKIWGKVMVRKSWGGRRNVGKRPVSEASITILGTL